MHLKNLFSIHIPPPQNLVVFAVILPSASEPEDNINLKVEPGGYLPLIALFQKGFAGLFISSTYFSLSIFPINIFGSYQGALTIASISPVVGRDTIIVPTCPYNKSSASF